MNTFEIGQIFEGVYPPEAARWCNANRARMEEIEAVIRQQERQELVREEQNIEEELDANGEVVKPAEIIPAEYKTVVEDVQVRRFQIVAIPAPTLEAVKERKLSELSSKFATAEADAHLTSSLGIVINAGEKANRDIDGLVKLMEAMPSLETVEFCCYDNSYHTVTLADLKTMQIEVILSGNALYQQKWAFREAINAAKTKEELEAIVIEFTFSDFSAQNEAAE